MLSNSRWINILIFILPVVAIAVLLAALLWNVEEVISVQGIVDPAFKIEVNSFVKEAHVKKMFVKIGSQVKKGNVLAELNVQDLLEEEKTKAEIKMKKAREDCSRAQKLLGKGYLSQQEEEKAKADYMLASSEYEMCLKRIEQCNIVSPAEGTVVSLEKKEGDLVKFGEPILIISGSAEKIISLAIKEAYIAQIKTGQKVWVYSRAYPYQKYGLGEAKISYISEYAREKDGQRYFEGCAEMIKCGFPLQLGSTVEAKIVIGRMKIWEMFFKSSK